MPDRNHSVGMHVNGNGSGSDPGRHVHDSAHAPWSDPDAVGLRDVVGVLRRNAWVILAAGIVGVAGGAWYIKTRPPEYRAEAVIRVNNERGSLARGLDGGASESLSWVDPIASEIEVMRSAAVIGHVVDQLGLRLVPVTPGFGLRDFVVVSMPPGTAVDSITFEFDDNGVRAESRGVASVAGAYGDTLVVGDIALVIPAHADVDNATLLVRDRRQAVDGVLRRLDTSIRENTDLVEVSFTAAERAHAQRVVNAIVTSFEAYSAQSARQEASRRRAFIEERLAATDAELVAYHDALNDFRRRERVYSSQEWYAGQQAGLMSLEVRRSELQSSARMYRSILAGIQRSDRNATTAGLQSLAAAPEMAQNPVIAGLSADLTRLISARDSIVSGPWARAAAHPDVVRIEQQIDTTLERIEQAVRSHLGALDAQLAAIGTLHDRTASSMELLPEVEAEEARLVQELETVQRMADRLREEYQLAHISEAIQEGHVNIVDLAALPGLPVRSGEARFIVLTLLAGLLVGAGLGLLRESFDTSIHHSDQMVRLLRIPGLGVIPRLDKPTRRRLRFTGAARTRIADTASRRAALGVVIEGRSASAESFRTLRTNLIFSRSLNGLRTLAVTSPLPSEGKTTTAANLAVAYAQQGLNVLLIDCDLRRPQVDTLFDVPRSPGLTDWVEQRVTAAEAIRKSDVERLSLLTSGTLPANPAEFLGGARMRRALKLVATHFEMVIIDTSPVLAATDAAVVGTMVDGVLVVLRAGQTERAAAQQAVHQLTSVGSHVVGAVLNDPDNELPRYGYYYGREYYGSDEPEPAMSGHGAAGA